MSDHDYSLFQKLYSYARSDYYPFHMPGHKRNVFLNPDANKNRKAAHSLIAPDNSDETAPINSGTISPESIDITEITGFDDLHHPEGILKEAQEQTANAFGAYKSFYLVNGSTAGILAAICSCTEKGGRILMARNCHKSVYHAAFLNELSIDYIDPAVTDPGIAEGISPEAVKEVLSSSGASFQAVVITSPTYDGIVSDIRAIADIVHAHHIPLIVDEAHGAHFGFSAAFPKKALAYGADIVIESLHKTLPALTQSAILLLADSPYINEAKIKRYLSFFQTSSPSYLLLAGIDRCTQMLQTDGHKLFSDFEKKLTAFYQEAVSLKNISVLFAGEHLQSLSQGNSSRKDPSKILISADAVGLNGADLFARLRDDYHLELEMASLHYVTALTTLMDTQEGFDRLMCALKELDQLPAAHPDAGPSGASVSFETASVSCIRGRQPAELWQAMDQPAETVRLSDCPGRICRDFIIPYPPGIPLIVPGEIISSDHVRQIREYLSLNIPVYGVVL